MLPRTVTAARPLQFPFDRLTSGLALTICKPGHMFLIEDYVVDFSNPVTWYVVVSGSYNSVVLFQLPRGKGAGGGVKVRGFSSRSKQEILSMRP